MSKAAKQSILILAFLLIGSFAFGGLTLFQKQSIEKQISGLQSELSQAQTREMKALKENKTLKDKLKDVQAKKDAIEKEFSGIDDKVKNFESKISSLSQEKDKLTQRVSTLQSERDDLVTKLSEKPEPKIVYRDRIVEKEVIKEVPVAPKSTSTARIPTPQVPDNVGDEYWAAILKEKAAIELELTNVNNELTQTIVDIEVLKKTNSDLELELGELREDRESILREIKHAQDLADTLSLDLARAKGDKKFVQDQFDRMKKDNENLRSQIKNLTSTKIGLEKSIVKITEEKNTINKKLIETESVIQNKIDEIWQIKESLNDKVNPSPGAAREIELPPIIVSASGPTIATKPIIARLNQGVGYDGNVVSVNFDNNFVIVDLGEKDGVNIGDRLGIYRETDYIGEVEVIQVRADIAAADIKQQAGNIKVGDVVK